MMIRIVACNAEKHLSSVNATALRGYSEGKGGNLLLKGIGKQLEAIGGISPGKARRKEERIENKRTKKSELTAIKDGLT